MSISLHPTTPAESEADPNGPTYRLSVEQYHRMKREGILTKDDRVELREGLIHRKTPSTDSPFYPLSVEQYHRMTETGILTKHDRVELLEGWLVAKMGKNQPHVVSATLTFRAISGLLPAGWFATKEDPVNASDSEPEPDIMIVRGDIRDYTARAPENRDVALVVEVSESSLLRDSSLKKRLYARSSFPVYWLINFVSNRVEVYTDPSGPTEKPDYLHRQDYGPTELTPLRIEGQEIGRIAVRDLLP
ncbi:Uma2 family endonuclease [Tundrisphaera lichenicola]|uniref:Uma2 family endonuclease n=1 Tax=Tundrisphaera lichenicola TaxID=2029860 RepID=UPI003EB7B2A7